MTPAELERRRDRAARLAAKRPALRVDVVRRPADPARRRRLIELLADLADLLDKPATPEEPRSL